MSKTDFLGDAFTVIRNAGRAKKEEVLVPWSNLVLSVCKILAKEGYIENFKEIDLGRFKKIKVYLKYDRKKSAFATLKRVSKPGRRIYVQSRGVPLVLKGYGIAIISTSSGILTDKEARQKGVGGEVLGMVW
ncbi:MAG: 30S ribosomal protein S8 [Candidatus Omnitrophota bacterium]|nr:MAG: 30S ribosomal protein S8 [Candidatus Omnitrophota bacterium]